MKDEHTFDRESAQRYPHGEMPVFDMLRQDGPEADFDFEPPKVGNELPDVARIEALFDDIDPDESQT